MEDTIIKAMALAKDLQNNISQNMQESEKSFHLKMSKLLANPKNKVMLIELLDKSFRTKDKANNFEFIEHILGKYGIADFFTSFEKLLLFAFLNFGKLAPNLSVPFFIKHIREDTKSMVLDNESLKTHVEERLAQNIVLNLNLIGEEVLGDVEAKYRMHKYEEALKSDYISYISIKITTIFSQINIIDFNWSKDQVVKRLDSLYALALKLQNESKIAKFINLDMEEFKDLELTVAAFMESIEKYDIKAGIVLQAYLPDSYKYLEKLLEFSKQRVKNGKQPIKIRFVKGANMESEETIASARDWPLPTFSRKIDTDSNYFNMLELILKDENYKYINIGIASHNIFLIAYAMVRVKELNAQESFSFEMLEGMSEQASQCISKMQKLILYAPVCDEAHFNNAIAYLVRRLDENTADDNFMRYSFELKVGDANWQKQEKLFLDSIKNAKDLDTSSKRTQSRLKEPQALKEGFKNEADTDFILADNRKWALDIKEKYENIPAFKLYPSIYEDGDDLTHLNTIELKDKIKSRLIASVAQANRESIEEALARASNSKYIELSHEEIAKIMKKAAQILRQRRGDLLGISALEVGKTFLELDPEISEAIDFVEFYPYSLKVLKEQNPKASFKPKGVVASIAPWNFPLGITTGCIAAPLSAGNAVIYKPSSLSPLSGYMICKAFWDAGIPKDALIYLPSKGSDISRYLLGSTQIKACILTGGEDSAKQMLDINPCLNLSAETGGKNATIVTQRADRDLAIKNIIHSAFSNSGQKCSATSLLILEKEIYEDKNFKASLIDAAQSQLVGSPFDFKNKIAALANEIDEKQKRALKELAPGESWALKPDFVEGNPQLLSPGIKYGVKKGAFSFSTELFFPLLSVVCANSLKEAIELANSTGYGLTAALESLDEREWKYFYENIEVGNIYINKPSTGAIVLRQPFGGVKKSAIGFGRKVGIFNYITQFLDISQDELDSYQKESKELEILEDFIQDKGLKDEELLEFNKAKDMIKSYAYYYENEFSKKRDFVNIRGEDNIFSYTKLKSIGYRVSQKDSLSDILGVILAAAHLKLSLHISCLLEKDMKLINEFLDALAYKNIKLVVESDKEFIKLIPSFCVLRYFAFKDPKDEVFIEAARALKIIANERPKRNGRFELLYYFHEKSLSLAYHRYGNLGARALDNKSFV